MLDMQMQKMMEDCNKAWKHLAEILENSDDPYNIMLTLNARYFNAISKMKDKEVNFHMKNEYLKLLEEKFG